MSVLTFAHRATSSLLILATLAGFAAVTYGVNSLWIVRPMVIAAQKEALGKSTQQAGPLDDVKDMKADAPLR